MSFGLIISLSIISFEVFFELLKKSDPEKLLNGRESRKESNENLLGVPEKVSSFIRKLSKPEMFGTKERISSIPMVDSCTLASIKISLNGSCIPTTGNRTERSAMICEYGVVTFNFSILAAPETIENKALE